MDNINIKINKIENFITKNFNNVKKGSIIEKRLIAYAYYLEKIKKDFNSLENIDYKNKNNLYLTIEKEINDLKNMIINSNKLP